MPVAVSETALPDVVTLGSLMICIPTNDETIADAYFTVLVEKFKHEFSKKRKGLAVFYDLEIEVEEVYAGSRRYLAKPKLIIKSRWEKIKNASKIAAFVIGTIGGSVAGYPAFKDGANEIYNDFQSVIEQVIDDEQKNNPDLPPSIESITPNEDDGGEDGNLFA